MLERETKAGEPDRDVAVGGGESRRGPGEGLREQQAVVDDVVVLEAGLGVPVAEALRDERERRLAGQPGGEHARVVQLAWRHERDATAEHAPIPIAGRA